MSEGVDSSRTLHLRYIRLPNQVLDLYDDLIYKSKSTIVGKSVVESAHQVVFDGRVVLESSISSSSENGSLLGR